MRTQVLERAPNSTMILAITILLAPPSIIDNLVLQSKGKRYCKIVPGYCRFTDIHEAITSIVSVFLV